MRPPWPFDSWRVVKMEIPRDIPLHWGRIGGATYLEAQGTSPLHTQMAGRWNSQAFRVYVEAGGEEAQFVS